MMEEDIYTVKKAKIFKIEDDGIYNKYSLKMPMEVPIDDLRYILKLFFDKAAVNMGKDSYDAPEKAQDNVIEFILKEFAVLPVSYIGMAIIRGSLGKYGSGRLVPNTVYRWLREITLEYDRLKKHEELEKTNKEGLYDLHKYACGKAICKKIDWLKSGVIDDDGWDRIPLKELAEREARGLESYPEMFGVKGKE